MVCLVVEKAEERTREAKFDFFGGFGFSVEFRSSRNLKFQAFLISSLVWFVFSASKRSECGYFEF